MHIKPYFVVRATSFDELEAAVNKAISEGYMPQGGYSDGLCLGQAMVRVEPVAAQIGHAAAPGFWTTVAGWFAKGR